ncbi:MAG: hypothetical protein ACM34K_01410 [Bacillota bacterium]
MRNYIPVIILILLSISSAGQTNDRIQYRSSVTILKNERLQLANSTRKAAFLEYNSVNKALGDIYCFDFKTSGKMKIVENNFSLSTLAWSADGTKLFFATKPYRDEDNDDDLMDDDGFGRTYEFDLITGRIRTIQIPYNNSRKEHFEEYLHGYFSINWTNKGIYYYCNPHVISFVNPGKDSAETITEFDGDCFVSSLSVSKDNKSMAFLISKKLGKRVPYAIGVMDLQTTAIKYLDRQVAGNIFDWKPDNQTILVEDASELYEYNVPQNKAVKLNIQGLPGEFLIKDCRYLDDDEIIYRYIPVTKDQDMYRSEIRIYNLKTGRSREVVSGLNQRKSLSFYNKK